MSAVLPPEVEALLREYSEATAAAGAWTKKARELRNQLIAIVNAVGYTTDKDRLDAPVFPAIAGDTFFEVRPKGTERLDQTLLKEKYPEAYMACLRKTMSYSIAIPNAKDGGDE